MIIYKLYIIIYKFFYPGSLRKKLYKKNDNSYTKDEIKCLYAL